MEYLDKFYPVEAKYGEHGRIYIPKKDGRIVTIGDHINLYKDVSLDPESADEVIRETNEVMRGVFTNGGLVTLNGDIKKEDFLTLMMKEEKEPQIKTFKDKGTFFSPKIIEFMTFCVESNRGPIFLIDVNSKWESRINITNPFKGFFSRRLKERGLKPVTAQATLVDSILIGLIDELGRGRLEDEDLEACQLRQDIEFSIKYGISSWTKKRDRVVSGSLSDDDLEG